MSTINDTDLFLVNRAGSSYKTPASNLSSVQDSDLFLVTRAGSSYKVAKSDALTDILDTDLLLCDRAGASYKVSGADFKAKIPLTWTQRTSITSGSLVSGSIANMFDGDLTTYAELSTSGTFTFTFTDFPVVNNDDFQWRGQPYDGYRYNVLANTTEGNGGTGTAVSMQWNSFNYGAQTQNSRCVTFNWSGGSQNLRIYAWKSNGTTMVDGVPLP